LTTTRSIVGFHCLDVLGKIAPRQNAGMDLGMQGLDPAVEHLRKPGVVGDLGNFKSGIPEQLGGAAGGNQRNPEIPEPARKLDHSSLVGDADQRLLDGGHADYRQRRGRLGRGRLQFAIRDPP
jgi:hypothetical protein